MREAREADAAVKYRVRMVEFVGEEEFPQGAGMTWDEIEVEVAEGDVLVQTQALYTSEGCRFDYLRPVVRLWLMSRSR